MNWKLMLREQAGNTGKFAGDPIILSDADANIISAG